MTYTNPATHASIREAVTRNGYARQIIAGFRSAMPVMTPVWDYLEDALNDVLVLEALLTRLTGELERARLDRANLAAAMRGTIAAHHDGEPDPLWYLRDELDALQMRHRSAETRSARRA